MEHDSTERNKSNWDKLADALGAKVPDPPAAPTPDEGELSAEAESAEVRQIPRVKLPPTPPSSAPAGWDSLANQLGIEAPPASISAADEASASTEDEIRDKRGETDDSIASHVQTEEYRGGDVGAEEIPAAEPWAPEGSSTRKADAEAPTDGESAAQDTQIPLAEFAGNAPEDIRDVLAEVEAGADEVEQEFAAAETEDEDVEDHRVTEDTAAGAAESTLADRATSEIDEESSAPATPESSKKALSFWESIFGPRQESAPLTKLFDVPARTEVEKDDRATADEEATVEMDQADFEGDFDDTEDRPRRRSRRGRRGRGRSQATEEECGKRDAESGDDVARSRRADEGDEDFLDDDELEDGDGGPRERSRPQKAKAPGHRNIPTWEDAIGVIVDSNLALRTEPRRGSSRGGARGRSRGRRKRKS